MSMTDKNGRMIQPGQSVLMPDPDDTDNYNHSFVGMVKGFHGEYVTVVDGDGDCFDIEPGRIEIQ